MVLYTRPPSTRCGRPATTRLALEPRSSRAAPTGQPLATLSPRRKPVPYIRTPQEAERNAAARMREMGFADAAVTAGGADGGVDVRASRAIAQVKWRGGMVSRPEVQKLF
ncbi:restriction endonuclease [Nocardia puris]|uniref:restriction endonuclease n=1 Tax=Nocardia puris TaxID=208602 RepID=UPI00397EFEBA